MAGFAPIKNACYAQTKEDATYPTRAVIRETDAFVEGAAIASMDLSR